MTTAPADASASEGLLVEGIGKSFRDRVVVTQGKSVARGDRMTVKVKTGQVNLESSVKGRGKPGRVRALSNPPHRRERKNHCLHHFQVNPRIRIGMRERVPELRQPRE